MFTGQNGNMMNRSGMWGSDWMGGYGGFWGLVMLVVVLGRGLLVVMQKRKMIQRSAISIDVLINDTGPPSCSRP